MSENIESTARKSTDKMGGGPEKASAKLMDPHLKKNKVYFNVLTVLRKILGTAVQFFCAFKLRNVDILRGKKLASI